MRFPISEVKISGKLKQHFYEHCIKIGKGEGSHLTLDISLFSTDHQQILHDTLRCSLDFSGHTFRGLGGPKLAAREIFRMLISQKCY